MADVEADVAVAGQPPRKRTFKKFNFRGVDLDAHLDMSTGDLVKLFLQKSTVWLEVDLLGRSYIPGIII
uniref:Uncharacterized protein n=1 Tax=Quercus lobata TaxID=97700 RepID=A0A7N2L777_QUELO